MIKKILVQHWANEAAMLERHDHEKSESMDLMAIPSECVLYMEEAVTLKNMTVQSSSDDSQPTIPRLYIKSKSKHAFEAS